MARITGLILIAVTAISAVTLACTGGDASPERSPTPQPSATLAPPSPTPDTRLTVVIDPGHGGDEVGAAEYGVVEKHSNLDFAFRIERLLAAQGYEVILTRREDRRVAAAPGLGSSFGATRFDLQARVDMANEARADVFVALHSNGSTSASESGVEVWYDPQRTFGAQNERLAQLLQDGVLASLAEYGYSARGRGLKDDTCFRFRNDRCFPLFVLGPPREVRREDLTRRGLDPGDFGFGEQEQVRTTRATEMPGVLVELLFITHASDAAVLSDEAGRDAIARGMAAGIVEFLTR
jgi:N-acetylmuramoyl-L-alanine amidase